MEIIKLRFYGNVIYCNKEYNVNINTNTCKMTEHNEFYFSIEYLHKHLDTLKFYITPLILKNNVEKIILRETTLIPYIKKFINYYKNIYELSIEEDDSLNVSDIKDIIEMKYVTLITCYDMNYSLYHQLTTKYNKQIKLRGEILFSSQFMKDNHLNTYSELCQAKQLLITTDMDNYDKEEFEYVINNNHGIKKIVIKLYTKNNIEYLSKILENDKIDIFIWREETLSRNDYEYLRKLKKKRKINLQLKYSENYQHKNAFKQLNLNLLRFSLLLFIVICFSIISLEHIIFARDKDNTDDVIDITKYDILVEQPVEEDIVEEPVIEELIVDDVVEEIPNEPYVSPYYKQYNEKFSELKRVNPDTIGWIKVNNTNVNYPVVHTTDNDYYLNHSFDKSSNSFGWIYADYRSNFDVLNQNTIIYGHNVIGTDLLFSTLTKTTNPSWYNNSENLTITFNTEKKNMSWQIFSIYIIPETNDYLITNFSSEQFFLDFVQKLKDRSIKDFGIEVKGKDKILTLSTCYKDSTHRVVIHAKLIS